MIEEKLTNEIEAGAKAHPRYSTDAITTDGGFVVTNQRWRYPLYRYEFNLEPGVDGVHDYIDALLDMFHAAGGSAEPFLFTDWRDNEGIDEPIGVGDGAETEFQLYRIYQKGAIVRRRKITRPVEGTVTAKVNGAPTAITLGNKGVITFGVAPALGAAITASFEFDVPVRFESDDLDMLSITGELHQPVDIVLVEQREK